MKKLILILIFTMLSNFIFSQQTYLKRLSFNYQNQSLYFHPEDSVLNFRNYSQYNGYSFIHFDNNRDDSKIAKLDSIGNILWSIGATHQGSIGLTWFNGLKGTSDGGCVYLSSDYLGLSGNYTASLVKYDTNGNLEWYKSVPQNYDSTAMIYHQTTYSLALTGNEYACLATDSIYLFDTSGAVIGNINYKGPGELIGFANEDLFLISNTLNARIDRQGNVRYTLSGTVLNYDTTLYLLIGDTLHQIEGMTGAYISSVYFPSSGTGKMLMLKDGGWIRYSQNTMTCFNSIGFQKWSRNFPLPRFGINLVAEQRDGTLLTGGTYISLDGVFGGTQDYSFFIATLDTAGFGIVDSFTQLFVGDADIDNIYEYSDAIYIALSQGAAGPAEIPPDAARVRRGRPRWQQTRHHHHRSVRAPVQAWRCLDELLCVAERVARHASGDRPAPECTRATQGPADIDDF